VTILVPSATLAAGPWTAVGRGGLHNCLEEMSTSDGDITYILAASAGTTGQFQLAAGSDGTGSTHTVTFRARGSGGPGLQATRLLVELYEAATWRGSQEVDLSWPQPYVYETFSFPVFGITDWADLRLHFTPTRMGATQRMRVTSAQLEYVASANLYSARGRIASPGVSMAHLACGGVKRGTLPHC
jgi:hypothetical protein